MPTPEDQFEDLFSDFTDEEIAQALESKPRRPRQRPNPADYGGRPATKRQCVDCGDSTYSLSEPVLCRACSLKRYPKQAGCWEGDDDIQSSQVQQRRPDKAYCDICGKQFGSAWQAMGLTKHKWEAHGIPGEASFNGRSKQFGPPLSWWGRQPVVGRVLYVSIAVGAVVGAFTAANPIQGFFIGALIVPTIVGGAIGVPACAYLMVSGTYSLIKKGLRVLFRSAKWLDRFLDP